MGFQRDALKVRTPHGGWRRSVRGVPRSTSTTPGGDGGSRSSRPPYDLSRGRLLVAAIAIVEAEGVAALSMRRLAEEVDRSTMAAYRHFADKQDLVDATVDAIVKTIPLPEPGDGSSNETLEQLVVDTYERLSSSPGLADLLQGRVVTHPAVAALFETLARLVQDSGADRDTATAAATALVWHIRGAARRDEQQQPAGEAIHNARADTDVTLRRATGQGPDPLPTETMLRTTTRLLLAGLTRS